MIKGGGERKTNKEKKNESMNERTIQLDSNVHIYTKMIHLFINKTA